MTDKLNPLALNELLDAEWDADKSVIESHLESIAKLNKDITSIHYWIHQRLRERPDLREWYESLIFQRSV